MCAYESRYRASISIPLTLWHDRSTKYGFALAFWFSTAEIIKSSILPKEDFLSENKWIWFSHTQVCTDKHARYSGGSRGGSGVQSNPPYSPNYFVFVGSFGKKLGKLIKSNALQQIWAPVSKILDPPLRWVIAQNYLSFQLSDNHFLKINLHMLYEFVLCQTVIWYQVITSIISVSCVSTLLCTVLWLLKPRVIIIIITLFHLACMPV